MAVPTYVARRSETAVSTTQRRRGISKVLANSSAGACEHIRYRGHKGTHMSLDLFMNDTCARCRKPLKRARIERHPTRRDLSVHKFECAQCGGVKTKVVFRKHVAAA